MNFNLDLNSVSETDITLAILKKQQQQTNKRIKIIFERNTNNCNLTVKQCDNIRLLLTELVEKTELQL